VTTLSPAPRPGCNGRTKIRTGFQAHRGLIQPIVAHFFDRMATEDLQVPWGAGTAEFVGNNVIRVTTASTQQSVFTTS
jgi:hypothetical protein